MHLSRAAAVLAVLTCAGFARRPTDCLIPSRRWPSLASAQSPPVLR